EKTAQLLQRDAHGPTLSFRPARLPIPLLVVPGLDPRTRDTAKTAGRSRIKPLSELPPIADPRVEPEGDDGAGAMTQREPPASPRHSLPGSNTTPTPITPLTPPSPATAPPPATPALASPAYPA